MVLVSMSFDAALRGSWLAVTSMCSLLDNSPHLQTPLTLSILSGEWNPVSKKLYASIPDASSNALL